MLNLLRHSEETDLENILAQHAVRRADASEEAVTEAVNDTLKAIAASLLMEQVLAPRFEFRPKRQEGRPTAGAYGDIRGWDAKTGKLLWTFHTVPRPGEPGAETWPADGWKNRSGVNVWSTFTVDAETGTLLMPIGGPSDDRYGGDRPGANLFGNSLVAVELKLVSFSWPEQIAKYVALMQWEQQKTGPRDNLGLFELGEVDAKRCRWAGHAMAPFVTGKRCCEGTTLGQVLIPRRE